MNGKKRLPALFMAACLMFLTACGTSAPAPAEAADPAPAETASLEAEAPAETAFSETAAPMVGIDLADFQEAMPAADYAVLERFCPVLREEETFRWVAGPYDCYPDGNWTPFDATMTDFLERICSGYEIPAPETLALYCLAVGDVDGDGAKDLVVLVEDGGYCYLVLHQEPDGVYGTSFPIRWFMDLQENGVYTGSGGVDDHTYHRMSFRDGVFVGRELAREVRGSYALDGENATMEDFYDWKAEAMVGGVAWYGPDGCAISAGAA